MAEKLIAKVNGRGVVWTSRYIAYGTLAYRMEAAGSTKRHYAEVEEIEVRPASSGKGWVVVVLGDELQPTRTKSEAQWLAEQLLDNPRDRAGWPLENCGRYAYR